MKKNIFPLLALAALAFMRFRKTKTLSREGLEFIKSEEDFSPTVYVLYGVDHIGYGHVIKEGEKFVEPISQDMGDRLLFADLKPAVNAINRLVKVELSQNQFDALTSFVYNVGPGAFAESTLLKQLNLGNYTLAADQFDQWVKATINGEKQTIPGLITRRETEKNMFLS